jgi:lactate permease
MNTAQILGYPIAVILAAQTSGAALASVLAPTKIVVGASTTGLTGKEGLIMAKLASRVLILILFVSILTVIFVHFSG